MEEEEVLTWVGLRVKRLYWLADRMPAIERSVRNTAEKREVYDFLMNHLVVLTRFKGRFEGSACVGGCRGLCCYFSRDHTNQLPITAAEIDALERLFPGESRGFWEMVPLSSVSEELAYYIREIPGLLYKTGEGEMACMIKPSERTIEVGMLGHTPKSLKKFKDLWVDSKSLACRFLDVEEGRCMLYGRLRFTICREFFCLTAVAMTVLGYLGLAGEELLKRPMEELNGISNSVAIAFRSKRLTELEDRYDAMVRELAESYVRGGQFSGKYLKLREFEREYDGTLKKVLGNAVGYP